MARVSRIRAASMRGKKNSPKTSPRGINDDDSETTSVYRSISSLKEEEEEEEFSCSQCCKSSLNTVFNFTIASCNYVFCCWNGRKKMEGGGDDLLTSTEDVEIGKMKEELFFHFMNPFQKWRYPKRRRFPWKLVVQLLTILLVTVQLSVFAKSKFGLTSFIQQNQRTFTQLFINNPVQTDEDDPIPTPIAKIYTFDELFDQLNHTTNMYFTLVNVAVGPYDYEWDEPDGATPTVLPWRHLLLRVNRYQNTSLDPSQKIHHISTEKVQVVYYVFNTTVEGNELTKQINWTTSIRPDMQSVTDMSLSFQLSSVYVDTPTKSAECFLFNITIVIRNDIHSGSMPVDLTVETQMSECRNGSSVMEVDTGVLSSKGATALDFIVSFFALVSIIQCVRSLVSSANFARRVYRFFQRKFNYRLKFHHILPLFNGWFVGVIASDLLLLGGSLLKIIITFLSLDSIDLVDITSIILGVATFGQWCCLLRFLSYFEKYNMLLLTLRLAMPSVVRFFICTGILYVAFLLCGWLVLGPYHPKFRDPSVTSECLFSLINGDDMYATYIGMSKASDAAWIFSKVYLYVFIALFIYVVLSVFISLISDTYETLHEHWKGRSKGFLQDFAMEHVVRPCSHHGSAVFPGSEDEDDYEMIREMVSTPTLRPEATPLLPNGGLAVPSDPPIVLSAPPGAKGWGGASINSSRHLQSSQRGQRNAYGATRHGTLT